jgi:ribosome-associated protein
MAMDEEHDDGLGGRSRNRREVTAANRWGRALLGLTPTQFAAAPLPEEVRAEAAIARAAPSFRARDRAVARVDALMRDLDEEWVAKVDGFLRAPPQAPAHPAAIQWRDRLLAQGDLALRALVDEQPGIDVQRLRQLVRNARAARPGAGSRARAALTGLLDAWFFRSVERDL